MLVETMPAAILTFGGPLAEDGPVVNVPEFNCPDGQGRLAIVIEQQDTGRQLFETDLVPD